MLSKYLPNHNRAKQQHSAQNEIVPVDMLKLKSLEEKNTFPDLG